MAMERANKGTPKLSREVLPPQKPNNGIGVMLVAATAMFFAVASSAFILRARMASEGCPSHNQNATTIQITAPERDQALAPAPPPPPVPPKVRAKVWNVPYYPSKAISTTPMLRPDECDRKDSVSCAPKAKPDVQ